MWGPETAKEERTRRLNLNCLVSAMLSRRGNACLYSHNGTLRGCVVVVAAAGFPASLSDTSISEMTLSTKIEREIQSMSVALSDNLNTKYCRAK